LCLQIYAPENTEKASELASKFENLKPKLNKELRKRHGADLNDPLFLGEWCGVSPLQAPYRSLSVAFWTAPVQTTCRNSQRGRSARAGGVLDVAHD
jgi:hypothetical protein